MLLTLELGLGPGGPLGGEGGERREERGETRDNAVAPSKQITFLCTTGKCRNSKYKDCFLLVWCLASGALRVIMP
jgi:hypothetical protein